MEVKRPTYAFSLDRRLMAEIDNRRGLIPRSRYVEQLINLGLLQSRQGATTNVTPACGSRATTGTAEQ